MECVAEAHTRHEWIARIASSDVRKVTAVGHWYTARATHGPGQKEQRVRSERCSGLADLLRIIKKKGVS